MNLYRIFFIHHAPKDAKEGIETYLLAQNDVEIYNYIETKYNYGCWSDIEYENNTYEIYDEHDNVVGTETLKEKILRLKGDANDVDHDFSDAYYGITFYGWELIGENVIMEDFEEVVALGIVKKIEK